MAVTSMLVTAMTRRNMRCLLPLRLAPPPATTYAFFGSQQGRPCMSARAWVGALVAALAVALALPQPGEAKTLKFANDGDVSSMDPYFLNETFLLGFLGNVYEPLVGRGKRLELVPKLAQSWEQLEPNLWRFHLRPNVKFAGGENFTADDVIFSYQRAIGEGSDIKSKLGSVKEVKKVDDLTVDFITTLPNPLLPGDIAFWYIMPKGWAEKNGAIKVAAVSKKEENYATYHTNGTGAFMVTKREPDVRTVAVPNPNWWNKPEHNLTEVEFSVIKSDATRVAALLSGEVDMVYTVPIQDVERVNATAHRKVLQGPEMRTIFLGMDQWRDELIDSDVKGKNPFNDVRVRRAFYQAIDEDAIAKKVMRGAATPNETGRGKFNLGKYSDPRLDALTTMVVSELDPQKRNAEISEAFKLHKEAFGHIPLHQQALAWGIKDSVQLFQRADNIFNWNWVTMD